MGEARSALLIGIGRYDNSGDLKSLDGPRVDVQSIRAVLEDPAVGGYRVETLEDVDSATACSHLEEFLRERSENETCLLYFSGHGFIDANGSLYLCTTNASFKRPKTSTIPASFVSELIDECHSKRVVLMLDCCYSGNYDGSAKAADVVQPQFVGTGFGRVVLTAGAENQLAWDNGDKGSLFSRHIAEGIRSGAADTDGDGRITVHELYDYVYKKVVSERPTQRPGKNTYRETGPSFLIAESRAKRAEQIPAWLHHELGSSVPETRCNALKALDELVEMKPGTRELVVERLRVALDDDSNRVRALARELLARFGDPQSSAAPPVSPPTATPDPSGAQGRTSAAVIMPPNALPLAHAGAMQDRERSGPDATAAMPESSIAPPRASLTVDLMLWTVWSVLGTTLLLVVPAANGWFLDEWHAYLCSSVFLIVYSTFVAARYREVPGIAAVFRSIMWWVGVASLALAFIMIANRLGNVFGAFTFFSSSYLGVAAFVKLTLRLGLPATIAIALPVGLAWLFGLVAWPLEYPYSNEKYLILYFVASVLVFSLGALARHRRLKPHAK